MLRLPKPLLIGLLAALAVLAPGGVAMAHDELLSSDPEDGATVQEAPEELVLTFNAQTAQVGAQLQITEAEDNDVADGDPVVQGTDLIQALTDLGSGDYEVVWRVTSSDGHPISGTFGFTVEAAEEPAAEDAAGEATEEATPEATEEATPEGTEEATATDTEAADEGGLPVWTWTVVGVGVLALLALLARTWSRGRS